MSENKTLNPTAEEGSVLIPQYLPSPEVQTIINHVYGLFLNAQRNRNMSFEYFDNRTLTEFINDSTRRFVTNVDEREGIEDWQARINDPFTRNKVIGILGRIAKAMPKAEFHKVGDPDIRRSKIITELVDHADRMDDTEELMFYALLEAVVKGTMVGYEGYTEKIKAIRDVESYNGGDELVLKEGKIIERKLEGMIVPLEDFYPSSVGIRKISDMPYCFWATDMTIEQFKMKFSNYPNAKFVTPGGSLSTPQDTQPFYKDYIGGNIPHNRVRLVRYYNQDTDEYVLLANAVWLNPLGDSKVMPLPFTHKKLPFWSAIYEPFGSDFFYGKSLADKLKAMQDVLNVLHNMLLDQSFLSIFSPLLVSGSDDIEDDFLRPGRRIPVNDVNEYKQLQIQPPGSWHQYILEFSKKILEETSLDAVSGGTAGGGDRTTATEIERAAAGVSSIIGLFGKFVGWGVRDKYRLRVKNVMQFYKAPLIEGILGDGGADEYAKAFNTFRVDDAVLTSGKRGIKIIDMYRSNEFLPKQADLAMEAKAIEIHTGKKVEKVAISSNYIRNFEVDVKIVPNTSAEQSAAMEKALILEKEKVYMTIIPDMLDREESAIRIAEAYGDDPTKVLRKDLFENPPQNPPAPGTEGQEAPSALEQMLANTMPGGAASSRVMPKIEMNAGGLPPPKSPKPESALSNQLVRGASQNKGSANLKQLMSKGQ